MSIVIHHGPPGSYKSAGVVQRFMIPALLPDKKDGAHYPEGRTVVTNIRGFDSIEKIEAALGVTCGENAEIIALETDTRESLVHAARWFHWVPIGALIVLDEAQAVYPAGRRDFKLESLDYPGGPEQADIDGRPADVFTAFDMHRHYNWDLFLCTPNIGKIHSQIRQSAQSAFRHWDMTGLLPWKKGRWKELEHDPENNGKSASHSIGVPKEYKIEKSTFECYQSTKTGTAKGPEGRDSIFKDPKLRMVSLVLLVCVVVFGYQGKAIYDREKARLGGASVPVSQINEVPVVSGASGGGQRDSPGHAEDSSHQPLSHPLAGFRFHIVGRFSDQALFHADHGDDEYSFTQRELAGYGYSFASVGDCRVVLFHSGHEVGEVYCKPRKVFEPEMQIARFEPLRESEAAPAR